MLKKLLVAIAVLIVGFVVLVALQPSNFRIERSIVVNAPAEVVFPHVNDFRRWTAWSPFEKLDPNLKRNYDGAPSGTGSVYHWAGNKDAGEGRATIIESRTNERIRIQLEFIKPYQATDIAEFTFVPEGQGTRVTWSLSGTNNFMFKAVGLFMNMDGMLGGEFDKGLRELKALSEAPAVPAAS